MNKHTATPWEVRDGQEIVAEHGNRLIAQLHAGHYPERSANAAFICKAVNAHEALVKAIKEAMTYIVKTKNESEQYETTVYNQCKQALNLAEGRE